MAMVSDSTADQMHPDAIPTAAPACFQTVPTLITLY